MRHLRGLGVAVGLGALLLGASYGLLVAVDGGAGALLAVALLLGGAFAGGVLLRSRWWTGVVPSVLVAFAFWALLTADDPIVAVAFLLFVGIAVGVGVCAALGAVLGRARRRPFWQRRP